MPFNLLGQEGPEGEINPAAPEAGEYKYEGPPGVGDNPGLSAPAAAASENNNTDVDDNDDDIGNLIRWLSLR